MASDRSAAFPSDQALALADQMDTALSKWDEPWPFEEPGQVARDVRVLIDGVRHWHNEYLAACCSLTKRVHQGAEAVRREQQLRAVLERIAAGVRPDGTYNLSREACEQLAKEALGLRSPEYP